MKQIKFITTLSLLVFAMLWSVPAQAQIFGSAVPDLSEGKMAAGVGLTSYKRRFRSDAGAFSADNGRQTLMFDYGLGDSSMLRVELGTVDMGTDRGNELAGSYRQAFGSKRKVGKNGEMTTGFFGGGRYYALSNGGVETDVLQLDGGAGANIRFKKIFSVYFSGLISYVSGNSTFGGASSKFGADSLFGLLGGVEATFENTFQAGLELHMLFDSGLGLYGRFMF